MEKKYESSWERELINFLIEDGIIDQSFYDFISERIIRLPANVNEFGWGVFPKIDENGILYDLRILVPKIYNELSLCINIHEYTHAYELYGYLGKAYKWDINNSEEKAQAAEKRYLNSIRKDE